ncbi:hypothetical protein HAZT_HAZT007698 [Hyalella azteca]|uniref:Reverse transcriptase domain-containing protein n=1 Tax=Hyalella azteca TaxID=294128 RepID=A0A6A0H4F1_HYAAZ|nr:hypothetical protein HAZT_HAZT007698 [Hyalella azteca]
MTPPAGPPTEASSAAILSPTHPAFTPVQTRPAVWTSGTSTATGPDFLTTLHLHHLGPRGIQYLTKLFNLFLAKANIPAIWKSARCSYNSCISSPCPVLAGVPQGSVIFNSYFLDFPQSAPLITSYADDFTAAVGAVQIANASAVLSSHSLHVAAWACRKGLSVSIPKSHTTLFTSGTHQLQKDPHVSWEGSDLPLCRTLKILGVTFNPHFTFLPCIAAICQRACPCLNILKSLAGTSWEQQKETLLVTFKALIKSLITYAAPVWFPNASPLAISKLQTT